MPEQRTSEQFDASAEEARQDLANLESEAVVALAQWWAKWYTQAGHKRLGRILVQIAKEE